MMLHTATSAIRCPRESVPLGPCSSLLPLSGWHASWRSRPRLLHPLGSRPKLCGVQDRKCLGGGLSARCRERSIWIPPNLRREAVRPSALVLEQPQVSQVGETAKWGQVADPIAIESKEGRLFEHPMIWVARTTAAPTSLRAMPTSRRADGLRAGPIRDTVAT